MTIEEIKDTIQTWIKNADDEFDREEMGRVYGLKSALRLIEKLDVTDINAGDLISRQAAIDALSHMMDTDGFRDGWAVSRANVDCMLRSLPSVESESKWIPIKTRQITPDEIEEFGWEDKDESWMWMYDCELPYDGQEVLIQSKYGIDFTTFYNEGSEGCYFENYEDMDDVIAWRPLPEKYQKEE